MQDSTTLVCLFHHEDLAQAALRDLAKADVPSSSISVIDNDGPREQDFAGSSLEMLGVPVRDQQHLLDGVGDGGIIIAVSAVQDQWSTVERIFESHSAAKIDEASEDDGELEETGVPLVGRAIPLTDDPSELGNPSTLRMYRSVVVVPVEAGDDLDEEIGTRADGAPTRRDL